MLLETIVGATGLIVGFYLGKRHTDNKTVVRLRNRGYTISYVNNYYEQGCRFTYNGFDKNLKSKSVKGPTLPSWKDAVANADAHYHAKIII